MRRSRGGPRSIRYFFLHCHTVDRGRAHFETHRKIRLFLVIPSIIPSMHSRWRSRRPFATPFSPSTFVAKTSLRGSFFFLSLEERRKRSCDFRPVIFWSERKRERGREEEKKKRDAGLYLSISDDRSIRGLDLRLDGCRQKCGLVYRWCYTRWRRSGDGFQR